MVGQDSSDSPLASAAGAAGPHTTEAFNLLSSEVRLAILLALWEAKDPTGGGRTLSFSELYDAVDVSDSGNFTYHLEKLEEQFIESTEEGYTLAPAGSKIVRAVISGSGITEPTLEPTEIDIPCPYCEAPTSITYRDGRLFHLCSECGGNEESEEYPPGTLFFWRLDTPGLADRRPEEVSTASALSFKKRVVGMVDRVCPACSGPVEATMKVCEDHQIEENGVCHTCGRRNEVDAVYYCTVCKNHFVGPPSVVVAQHPAVIAFYYEHGIQYQYDPDIEVMNRLPALLWNHSQELVSTDPPRVTVTIRYDGDEISLTLDEEMRVVEVDD